MIVTEQMLDDAKTENGGYTKSQVDFVKMRFPKKWKSNLIGSEVSDDFWNFFCAKAKCGKAGRIRNNKVKKKAKQKERSRQKAADFKRKCIESKDFYYSREWRALRVKVLEIYECKCVMCGRSPKDHGIVIHVDHIKPRSTNPDLSLELSNLQILCEDCNLGKSNNYQTDWRPIPETDIEFIERLKNDETEGKTTSLSDQEREMNVFIERPDLREQILKNGKLIRDAKFI